MACFCQYPSISGLWTRAMYGYNGYRQFPTSDPLAARPFPAPDQEARDVPGSDLMRAESMEISNDPRFFIDSVLDKRLAAFGSLVVASTLMMENSADEGFAMRKTMSFSSVESALQLLAFLILMGILIANAFSIYIGVAQPYHALRLATSGPAGFEASTSYYLHKDMVVWRHFAVKCMLLSVPWFVLANGLRMVPKFAWDAKTDEVKASHSHGGKGHKDAAEGVAWWLSFLVSAPFAEHIASGLLTALFLVAALAVWFIHTQHYRVFHDNYERLHVDSGISTMLTGIRSSMHRRNVGRFGGPLHV